MGQAKVRGTPPFELLCLAAHPSADPGRTRRLLDADLDWAEIVARAADHGLRPALIELLSASAWRCVPPPARRQLESFQHRHLLRTLAVADELAHLAHAFQAQQIPFVLFKGAALAVQLYQHLAAREFNDIDLIVPIDQVERAETLLDQRGYRPIVADRAFRRFFLGHQGQCAFRGLDGLAGLDLHWSFAGAFLPFPLSSDAIWHDLSTVAIAGDALPVLRREDVALLLAGHGTKEGWRSLMWLRDFAHVVARWTDVDWLTLYRRARSNGCGDAILLACAVVERVLDVPPPEALAPILEANRKTRALAERHAERLLTSTIDKRHLDDLGLCDRPLGRLRAGLGFALAPTSGDYEALPLPRVLWPAYYLLRPVRLAGKAVAGRLPLP
jgi:hypothetical protein